MKRKPLICAALAACMVLSGCSDLGKVFQFRTNVVANNVLNGDATKQYKTAIMNGNIEWIEEIIANNPGLDVNYCEDSTALYCACYKSYISDGSKSKTITALVDSGVEVTGDILSLTLYNGDFLFTQALLKANNIDIDFDYIDENGNTFISMAVQGDKGGKSIAGYQQIKMLIEAGMKITPEFFADNKGENEIGTHFLNVKFSPNTTKYLMQLLIDNGQESGLKKALEYALSGQLDDCLDEIKNNSLEGYNSYEKELLTDYAAYFGTPEQYDAVSEYTGVSHTPDFMRRLAESGNAEMFRYLSEKLSIDYSNVDISSFAADALDYAAAWGHSDICQYLCDNNIKIIDGYITGYIPLSSAILSEDIDTVKVIYNYIKSCKGICEFDIGRAYNRYIPKDNEKAKKIFDFFFDEGFDLSCVEFGFMNSELAEYLYAKGRPLTPTDLTYAVYNNNTELAKTILEKGAYPNQKSFKQIYEFPWNVSYDKNKIETALTYQIGNKAEYEIDYNTFVDYYGKNYAGTRNGEYILFTAIQNSNSEIVKLLIDNSADINKQIYNESAFYKGMRPIHYCIYGSAATLRGLLDAGVDENIDCSNIGDKNAKTLSEFYERNGRSDLAQIVKEYEKK